MKTSSPTAKPSQPPVRKIRDRDASPAEPAKPELKPKVKRLLLDKIKEREAARMRKNAASNEESAAKKELEALMDEHKVRSVGGEIEIDGAMYDTSAVYVEGSKKVIDLDMLQRLVKKDVWKKCLVAQVGLVEKFAGKNVVQEATTYETTAASLEITSTKKGEAKK